MQPRDRERLLFAPYRQPGLRRGDRALCLYRDALVEVTTWTDARIPWPRCKPLQGRSAPSLLVDDELLRAIRHEASVAVCFWWGVSENVVRRWRTTFSVTRTNNPGTYRLVRAAAQAGAAAVQMMPCPEELRERRRRNALEKNYAERLINAADPRDWTAEELALLGTADDAVVASKIGRTVEAVRLARTRRKIPTYRDRRRRRES